jgi:ERCC4-related helicase
MRLTASAASDHCRSSLYRTGNYIDEAVRTVNTANAEVIWAEKSIKTVRKELNSLLDGTLNKVRQAKYDKADDYLSQQRVIHEAEQAEIERAAREKEQAITDKENGFLQVIKLLLYITRQGG